MHVTTLSTQLGLGSDLVDWYWDEAIVFYGQLLIDLSPRRDDRLRSCINTGAISTKFHISDRLKPSKSLDDEHRKSSVIQVFQTFFSKWKKFFLRSPPEDFISFFFKCMVSLRRGTLPSLKRHPVTKVHLKGKKRLSVIQKKSIIVPPSTIWFILIRSSLFSLSFLWTAIKVCILWQVQNKRFQNIQFKNIPRTKLIRLKKGMNKELFAEPNSSVVKFLSFPGIKLTSRLYGVEKSKMKSYCQTLLDNGVVKMQTFRHMIYSTRRCCYISDFGSEQKCQIQTKMKIDLFQKTNVKSCKAYTHGASVLSPGATYWKLANS